MLQTGKQTIGLEVTKCPTIDVCVKNVDIHLETQGGHFDRLRLKVWEKQHLQDSGIRIKLGM